MVKNLPANAGDIKDAGSIPGSEDPLEEGTEATPLYLPRESHGRRSLAGYSPLTKSQTQLKQFSVLPVFLPEKSHGQRSLVGYSSWGPKSPTQLSN